MTPDNVRQLNDSIDKVAHLSFYEPQITSCPLSLSISQANDPFSRCSTPFVSMTSSPFNHNQIPPHSYPPHQRLPPNFPHAAAAHNYWYSVSHSDNMLDARRQVWWIIIGYFSDNLATTSSIAPAPSQLDDESLHEESPRLIQRCSNASFVDTIQPKCTKRETENGKSLYEHKDIRALSFFSAVRGGVSATKANEKKTETGSAA